VRGEGLGARGWAGRQGVRVRLALTRGCVCVWRGGAGGLCFYIDIYKNPDPASRTPPTLGTWHTPTPTPLDPHRTPSYDVFV